MIALHHVADSPFVIAIGWALVHFAWQASLLAVLAWLLLLGMRTASSPSRYFVACTALGLMVMAALLTCGTVFTRVSTCSPVPDHGEVVGSGSSTRFVDSSHALRRQDDQQRWPRDLTESERGSRPAPVNSGGISEGQRNLLGDVLAPLGRRLHPVLPWLVLSWGMGVCVLSLRLLAAWHHLSRLKSVGVGDVPEPYKVVVSELCRRLGVNRAVTIMQSSLVDVPSLIGWLQPIILMPTAALTGLNPSELRALIAHELAHVRRGDHVVNLLQTIAETLLFYHPAVWWISARIREEREHCCDDCATSECEEVRRYVGDLVPATLQHDGSVVSDFALLQQQLKQSVLPKSWSDSGGLAEMEGFPTNQVLVVTHSQAGHHAIARQLAAMRQKLPADK